jgi:hypothetical protein
LAAGLCVGRPTSLEVVHEAASISCKALSKVVCYAAAIGHEARLAMVEPDPAPFCPPAHAFPPRRCPRVLSPNLQQFSTNSSPLRQIFFSHLRWRHLPAALLLAPRPSFAFHFVPVVSKLLLLEEASCTLLSLALVVGHGVNLATTFNLFH